MKTNWVWVFLAGAVGLGCGDPEARPPPPAESDSGPMLNRPDTGVPVPTDGAVPPRTCPAPRAPFGADPDFDVSFPDLAVTTCDGTELTLGEYRCQADATLYSIGAGWCAPCIVETPTLQEVYDETRGESISVVQIMFDGADASGDMPSTATQAFCQAWVDDVADNWSTVDTLTLPVVIEPAKASLEQFEAAFAPLNLIVDRAGKVQWASMANIPDKEFLLQQLRDVASR